MNVDGQAWRSVWANPDGCSIGIIDQTRLPHVFEPIRLATPEQVRQAIVTMQVRGAPLIGAVAAYGVAIALRAASDDRSLQRACDSLLTARPTAVNLRWALDRMRTALSALAQAQRADAAWQLAGEIADEDVHLNQAIGKHGLALIRQIAQTRPATQPVNILTHCNAGWLATVDLGTATAPIYRAHDEGIAVHVWVDETRPRNQGASLTTWELARHGVPHTLIVDNAGGHLMQHGQVDLCIVGSDRTTARGDVCNKIGTYLKALAAQDNGVPFYVALPSSTIDWSMDDGVREIPIESRAADEVLSVSGRLDAGGLTRVRIAPEGVTAANPAFDVTPARLVSGLITERGICTASAAGLLGLFPEHASRAQVDR